MFKKKDIIKTINSDIPARFVKKDGVAEDNMVGAIQAPTRKQKTPIPFRKLNFPPNDISILRYPKDNKIPSDEISESYISNNCHNVVHQKNIRQRFSPSFLLLRKKKHPSVNNCDLNGIIKEEDMTDIVCYKDVAEHESTKSITMSQLDDTQLHVMDLEACEREYKARMEYIMKNYRHPPPYQIKKQDKPKIPAADTPLISKLLKETQLKDNTSMNNYWQSNLTLDNDIPQVKKKLSVSDKLVKRTREQINLAHNNNNNNNYYNNNINKVSYFNVVDNMQRFSKDRDTMSAVYGDQYNHNEATMRGCSSVPNLSIQYENSLESIINAQRVQQPRAHLEPGELELLISHYRKSSLDILAPDSANNYFTPDSANNHFTPDSANNYFTPYLKESPSYVPPSAYLNAEIPDWLQVYAKASPDLDKYLKWEMFRYPELDCWQTMLKRLYRKEVEQVVLWYEEYRIALQQEVERRSISFKKTHV
ncbi:uncharacterized protein LOC101240885 isoform X1 [Hydra vulgaris]|uniref:Protein salvador homolog 1 n=1 Tax=Hydra vulgaris TaxID=6087 RepID=T2M622_HYDVU|nr:uncharacterized protein LOC101240885 [Hydra vulgaris]